MNPYVKSVQPRAEYRLFITFENGEKRIFDLTPYLGKPVFAKLKNVVLFNTARVVSGSVEWQEDVDLSYDTLYLESEPVQVTRPRRNRTYGKKKNLAMATIPKKKSSKERASAK